MLATTDRFQLALRETHSVSVAARVYRPSAPTVPVAVPVVGGEVVIDRDARVRRQASLEVAFSLADGVTRDVVRELPYGGTCAIERGITYADGTNERVQLGLFRVDSVAWSELAGAATLTLSDRMAQIQDEPFVTPFAAGGLKPSDAIVAAVQAVYGSSILYHVETTPAAEPTLADVLYEEDRASAITDLAAAADAWAYFDHLGDLLIRPRSHAPALAWTIDAGPDGVLTGAEETLDRSSVRNGVSVRGQADASSPPIYALATNDDPSSPTRWGGPFGRVALISSSTSITTQAQADATAAALLRLRLGLSRTVTLTAVPNPALEPDDEIRVVYADGRTETLTVNAVRIGLDAAAALTVTTTSQLEDPALELALAPVVPLYVGGRAWRELEDEGPAAA